jgi:eukaryotic-like serine/threonine-protein kinase
MAADEPMKSQASTTQEGPRGSSGGRSPSMRPGGPSSLIGLTLSGRYRIERLLGEGGMGAVYQAEHTHMRKRLAVKVLHPEMSRLPEVVARFEREAMAAAHIDHPNVATATDFGKLEDGSFFLVLEYVEGTSLRDAIGEGVIELGRALHIMRQIAAALHRAHALGIVHRDLKPENVMLVERDGDADFVKVLDFGIAKVPVGDLADSTMDKGPVLTQLGMVYGTPEYMAPEQALGQNVDARADLYAVGAMTFEMLTQTRPYDHESKVALLGMHVTAPIPTPSERAPHADIPPEVDAIVVKLMAKETADRFQDARELIEAVNATLMSLAAQGRVDARFGAVRAPASSQLAFVPVPPSTTGATSPRASALAATEVPSVSGAVPAPAPSVIKLPPKTAAAIGAGIAAVLTLAIALIVVLTRGGGATMTTLPDGAVAPLGSGSATGEAPASSAAALRVAEQIKNAIALANEGDYATAIAKLVELEESNPARPDIHRALVDAYMGTKRPVDAMDEAGRALNLDATLAKDKGLRLHVRNVALTGGKGAEDDAFELLEGPMGADGADVLYDIAYIVTGYPKQQARARVLLRKPEVRAKATDELNLALDVRETSQRSACDLRRYFERAESIGDWRTVHVLKGFQATKGCGFLGQRDCWACLHGDGALARAIKAIDERGAAKKE